MTENNAQAGWSANMNAEAHLQTYDAFVTASKWGVCALVVLLALMAYFLV
jgi:hypothetical protein